MKNPVKGIFDHTWRGNNRRPTMKTGHEYDLALDSTGNVFAIYLIPSFGWRLRVRSTGPRGSWGKHVSLPDESYGYRLAPDAENKVHLIYGENGRVWHNGVSVEALGIGD